MIRLSVRCSPAAAERVLAELVELVPGGVEEQRGEGWVEYAVYGAPGELPELPDLSALAGDGKVDVATEEIPDDWADRWRDFHRPVLVADRLVVRPSWEPTQGGADGLVEVTIDPGQAFGTGAHATTRMCLELLLALADGGDAHGPLADLGTGSGVLAIAAAKLGFTPVIACDHELASLEATTANAAVNGVELSIERRNLGDQPPPEAAVLVANLTAPLLRAVAERLSEPPQHMVCSGLLAREADGLSDAFAARGLIERTRLSEGDWTALLLERGRGSVSSFG